MSEKKDNPGFVTHVECTATMLPLLEDIAMIKKALIGEDMKGGIVKDFNDMKNDISDIKDNQTEKKVQRDKWKWTSIGLAFTIVGFLVKYGLDKL
jgi:hypothetical protein